MDSEIDKNGNIVNSDKFLAPKYQYNEFCF